jgi:DNA-binding transcriptional LysR family regulator
VNVEIPELLTVRQAAEILKLSPSAVSRRFAELPGVINLGTRETFSKRRYTLLRIPRAVLERFINTHKVR